ncbi:MAG: methenyltetrahydromethanopterin cyclohydrolase [Candidatus Hydrothermarchaeales archaeon]
MNLNQNATLIAMEMIERQDELDIDSFELNNGTKVIDCGVKATGSFEAGRLFSLACLGGLAEVQFQPQDLEDFTTFSTVVDTDYPALACMASQKAGWSIKIDKFSALGSGPARILAKKPKAIYKKLGFEENAESAVLALECNRFPTKKVGRYIAKECKVKPDDLYLLTTRTASVVGAIQISTRATETALFKLDLLGYPLNGIIRTLGMCLIAPIVGDNNKMMGVTNDMIIYGSKVRLEVIIDIDAEKIPSNASKVYGKPFSEIFEEAGRDFYKVDPWIFAPAEVSIFNLKTGEEQRAGEVNLEAVKRSITG